MSTSKRVEMMRSTFRNLMKDVGTSIPGHVLAFDPQTQLAQLQVGVQGVRANGEVFTHSPLIECPVCVYGGTNFLVEVQIDPGTEGIIIFSQRCIDGWVESGGVAENPILRFHDFDDAYFIPGIRSQPNRLTEYANNGIRLRNRNETQFVWLKSNGDIQLKGTNVDIMSDTLTHNGANIGDDHVHGGVEQGGGSTGGPQ